MTQPTEAPASGARSVGAWMERLLEARHPIRRAWAIALGFALFRAWYVWRIDLAPDEAYYWEWSRHLALSYYDQGPLLGWAIRLGTCLGGTNEFGVRLMSILAGLAVTGLAVHALDRELGRPQAAPWLALALNGMLLFSVGGVLMMHDSLMGAFWMLGLVAALKALRDSRWWLAAGLAGAAAILSKYTGVLFFGAVLAALLSHRALRHHWRSAWLWAGALGGGGLGLAPILLWNHAHGWPSFQHVGSLAGGDPSRRSWATLPEFLGSQLGLVTPVLFGLMTLAWWRGRGAFRQSDPRRCLLWCLGALPFLFFLALSLRTRVEGNWPAQAYLAGLLLLAWDLELRSRSARWALGIALGLSLAVHIQAAWPFLPLRGRWARAESLARVDGWKELAARVDRERAALGPGAFIACRTYQNAAELAFYCAGRPHPVIVQDGSINHQYRFWNRPEDYAGRNAVIVIGQDWEIDEMRRRFASLERRDDEVFLRRGAEARRTRIYLGRGFRP